MPHHGSIVNDDELNEAGWAGAYGAINGAARWGIYSALAGGLAYAISPVYRGLTFQFKVFLQMSGMTVGSVLEADRRLRAYEVQARRMRKIKRDAEVWRRYEEDYARVEQNNNGQPQKAASPGEDKVVGGRQSKRDD